MFQGDARHLKKYEARGNGNWCDTLSFNGRFEARPTIFRPARCLRSREYGDYGLASARDWRASTVRVPHHSVK